MVMTRNSEGKWEITDGYSGAMYPLDITPDNKQWVLLLSGVESDNNTCPLCFKCGQIVKGQYQVTIGKNKYPAEYINCVGCSFIIYKVDIDGGVILVRNEKPEIVSKVKKDVFGSIYDRPNPFLRPERPTTPSTPRRTR